MVLSGLLARNRVESVVSQSCHIPGGIPPGDDLWISSIGHDDEPCRYVS